MRLIVDHQNVLAAADLFKYAVDQCRVAFDEAGNSDRCPLDIALRVPFLIFLADANGSLRFRGVIGNRRVILVAARRPHFIGNDDRLLTNLRLACFHHPRRTATLRRTRLEFVPVLDQHPAALQVRHHRLGHQVTRAIQARLVVLWMQFAQAAADRYVGPND